MQAFYEIAFDEVGYALLDRVDAFADRFDCKSRISTPVKYD